MKQYMGRAIFAPNEPVRPCPRGRGMKIAKNYSQRKKPLAFLPIPWYNNIVVERQRADIAQQVERILGKDEVPGSNPGSSSIF